MLLLMCRSSRFHSPTCSGVHPPHSWTFHTHWYSFGRSRPLTSIHSWITSIPINRTILWARILVSSHPWIMRLWIIQMSPVFLAWFLMNNSTANYGTSGARIVSLLGSLVLTLPMLHTMTCIIVMARMVTEPRFSRIEPFKIVVGFQWVVSSHYFNFYFFTI